MKHSQYVQVQFLFVPTDSPYWQSPGFARFVQFVGSFFSGGGAAPGMPGMPGAGGIPGGEVIRLTEEENAAVPKLKQSAQLLRNGGNGRERWERQSTLSKL